MAKILKDTEMIEIIRKAPDEIDCQDAYIHFLEDLGTLIADHFGGIRSTVDYTEADDLSYTCAFHVNECVPTNGGVFKNYDKDVTWKDGEEVEE
jgi:hypothetical protein